MKNCWIIGASSGIGLELAKKYFNNGNNVIISARREDELVKIKQQILTSHHNNNIFDFITCDVANRSSFENATKNFFQKFKQIDLVIFCPAIYQQMNVEDFDCSLAKNIINVNLSSFFDLLDLVVKKMIETKSGQIGVIASVAGYRGLPRSFAYGASKSALINLCEGINPELKKSNLKLSIINPGFVDTRLTKQNKFHMPFMITDQIASDYIYQGLQKNQFEIHFPKRFTLIMKILRIIPSIIYQKIIAKI